VKIGGDGMQKNFFNAPHAKYDKYVPELSYPTTKKFFVHAVSLTPHARCLRAKIDHISLNSKQNFKKAVARESGAQGVLFDENRKSKMS
jgi:hypothetical protein